MDTGNIQATAGLGFRVCQDLDIVEVANHTAAGIEALGHRVTGTHILSDTSARVATAGFSLTLSAADEVLLATLPRPVGTFLAIAVAPTDGQGHVSRFFRDSLLARLLQKLLELLEPDFVKWVDTDVLLGAEDFAHAVGLNPRSDRSAGKIRPRRPACRKRLPDIEETNEKLQQRIRDHDPAIFGPESAHDRLREIFSDGWIGPEILAAQTAAAQSARTAETEDIVTTAPLRLSTWLVSFAVTLFALPVGITLLVLNLVKGENLRLSLQAAALTGTFIALQAFGTMAHAMTTLKDLIG